MSRRRTLLNSEPVLDRADEVLPESLHAAFVDLILDLLEGPATPEEGRDDAIPSPTIPGAWYVRIGPGGAAILAYQVLADHPKIKLLTLDYRP